MNCPCYHKPSHLTPQSRTRWKLLSLCHMINDLQAQVVETFSPVLVLRLGLSIGEAGSLASLGGLMHVLIQPVTGYLSDRSGHNRFILLGIMMSSFFGFMVPLSNSYLMALLWVFLWGMGTAAFHPQAQGAAGYVAREDEVPMAISLFSFGGMLGTSLGPLYETFLYQQVPHQVLPLAGLVLPALAVVAVRRLLPRIHEPHLETPGLSGLPRKLASIFLIIWPVWIVTFMRDCTKRSLVFLIPLLVAFRGGDLTTVGSVLFAMSFLSALLPVLVARWLPKAKAHHVLMVTMPVSSILLFTSRLLPLWGAVPMLMAGGILLTGSISLTETLAQSQAPNNRSTVSSLTMGFSFGLGGVFLTPVGFLADQLGIEAMFPLLALLPLCALMVVLLVWPRRGLR